MRLQNEYLIIIDKETSSGFYSLCDSIPRFNEVLEKNRKNLKITKNKLSIDDNLYKYSVKKGQVKGKDQFFFHITLEFNNDEEFLNNYRSLLRDIKNIFHQNQTIVETLRDDLSFYYSQLSYSLIHKIENLMRKFITYFMITNVGKNWVNESSPIQIKEALDKSKRKQYIDVLQQLDFIHLGDFLFKAYSKQNISYLFEKIKISDGNISTDDIKDYIPQSNWDKYFKEKVDCDDVYLKKRWEQLYELRNKIAHSSHFTLGDYEDIQNLVSEIEEKLEKAFSNIDAIELLDEDKEQLSQTIATNINEDIGEFLEEWSKLEKQIEKLVPNQEQNFLLNFKDIQEKGYFDQITTEQINYTYKFRNGLVHGIDTIDNSEIKLHLSNIKKINNILQLSWKIEVLEALHNFKGEATLNEIYQYIQVHTKRELPASWKSSIRKTIYHHSSDVELYLGKEDLFEHKNKGKWGLRVKNPAT